MDLKKKWFVPTTVMYDFQRPVLLIQHSSLYHVCIKKHSS